LAKTSPGTDNNNERPVINKQKKYKDDGKTLTHIFNASLVRTLEKLPYISM